MCVPNPFKDNDMYCSCTEKKAKKWNRVEENEKIYLKV